MSIEEIRKYCLKKEHVTEDMPFGDDVLVFRVGGKIFLLTNLSDENTSMNLKCDPVRALDLRDHYTEVTPGYHMNKKHWNTVNCEGGLSTALLMQLIDHSYDLVWKSLTKKQRETLGADR